MRTNAYRLGPDGDAIGAVARVQARPGQDPRPAAAAADVRDLGVLAAGRGRAPAGRARRPRRPALERPAGGLPHRGARPHEGPDGEERRDRARRGQGRLRREAAAGRPTPTPPRPRSAACYRDVRRRPARRHRQHRRRRGRAPARGRAPRRRRPVPRRGGRQGHGHLLRPGQRGGRRATASGWATPSPPGARRATTTRRMGITARGAWESVRRHFRALGRRRRHRRRSPWSGIGDMSGDVFGNGMLRSRPPAAGRRLRPPPRLPRPRPRPGGVASRSGSGCSSSPARRWDDYDRDLISPGGGVWPRSAKAIPLSDRGARGARHRGRQRSRPTELLSRHPQGARRPAVERRDRHVREGVDGDQRRGRRPGQRRPCGSTAPTCAAAVVGEGGNLGFTQRGRVEFARQRRAHQHRRHRQLGRRRLLRPRGQHQDPARRRGGRRRPHGEAAQRAAGRR